MTNVAMKRFKVLRDLLDQHKVAEARTMLESYIADYERRHKALQEFFRTSQELYPPQMWDDFPRE